MAQGIWQERIQGELIRGLDEQDTSPNRLRTEAHRCGWCYLNISHTERLHVADIAEGRSLR